MGVVIKTFQTPLGCYVYDRSSNMIIRVEEDEYPAFQKLENGKEDDETAALLAKYRGQGICRENVLEKIEHPATQTLSYHLEHRVQKVTLQLTQNCNLRCDYCAYSGKYNQRTHNSGRMSLDTVKKSIDYAIEHSDGVENLNIGFYGGEPLLEFEDLKNAVKYVDEKYHGRKVNYSITTNGTIMSGEIVKFLMEHDFSVLISLDGPKELHNKNRVFANGEGSFDKIMQNLRYVKDNYPVFFEKISFNTVVPPGSDYQCIDHFFSANDIIEDNQLSKTTVSEFNIKDAVSYDDRYFVTYKYQSLKILMAALGFYSKKKISKLFSRDFVEIQRFYDHLGKMPVCASCAHPGGPCIPGARRPMVDIDGNIFPCERVSERSDAMRIGHVNTGCDTDKVDRLLNIGKLTEQECKRCWNFAHCGLCASAADDGKALVKEKKLSYCESSKRGTLNTMRSLCLLHEYHYDFEGDFFNEEDRVVSGTEK